MLIKGLDKIARVLFVASRVPTGADGYAHEAEPPCILTMHPLVYPRSTYNKCLTMCATSTASRYRRFGCAQRRCSRPLTSARRKVMPASDTMLGATQTSCCPG